MEYSGLIQKYKVNRPLTDEEKQLHFAQKEKLDVAPSHLLAVTKINSTFLETADKYYGWRGSLTAVMLALICIFGGAYIAIGYILLIQQLLAPETTNQLEIVVAFLIVSALCIPFLALLTWTLRKESFTYTHYPIRLNRKNRTMHIFRLDGTVLTILWDEAYFTLGRGSRSGSWDVRCHVLEGDGVTVKETFALGMEWTNTEDLKRFWEFHRRYMDEGPQAITDQVKYCLPIVECKEPYLLGLRRLTFNFAGLPIFQLIASPFFLIFSLGRVFAMKTSKIPHWPKEVEDACRIAPNDPFEKDARHNPPESWLWKLVREESK